MNTVINLLRAPIQLNVQRFASSSTVSKLTSLLLNFSRGYESIRPNVKQYNGSSILSQRCSQLFVPQIQNSGSFRTLHILTRSGDDTLKNILASAYNKISLSGVFSVRTKVRDYFTKPNELKRIRKHGWKKRMSTKAGREIIMRRILRGRHCITH